MPIQVTYWLWQFDSLSIGLRAKTYHDVAMYVRAIVPTTFGAGLMVKSHSGAKWQNAFDTHELAISGPDSLRELAEACGKQGIQLGAWGQLGDDDEAAGSLAGRAQAATGYYVLDLEPYPGFNVDTSSDRCIAGQAARFWRGYEDAGGGEDCGVSLVPQPSGVLPFNWALRYWLMKPKNVHLQLYYGESSALNPDVAIPYWRDVLRVSLIQRTIIPIFEREQWREAYGRWQELCADGIDVWRL